MDFIKKIKDIFSGLIPSKKNQDNINVPPVSATQETPMEAPEPEPIKQDFGTPEVDGGAEEKVEEKVERENL